MIIVMTSLVTEMADFFININISMFTLPFDVTFFIFRDSSHFPNL